MTEYTTVSIRAEDEFTEKRSRFIGYIKPVTTAEEAMEFVAEIKAMHKQATHNVWAYNLRDGQKRYSDDGEPQGTAGIPVLEVLTKGNITDAVVVVTRYFGGILLGGGGLVRAYSHGAKIAVDAGKPVTMAECVTYSVTTDYTTYGKINYALDGWNVKLENTDFGEEVTLTVVMKQCHEQNFLDGLRELSAGRITPTLLTKSFRPY